MTQGIIIFAYDNEHTPYTKFAVWSAARIKRLCGLPVSLITDSDRVDQNVFDQIIIEPRPEANGSRMGSWFNRRRYRAYQLSPYDKTIMLDADYVVSSNCLTKLYLIEQPIIAMRWAYDCTGRRDFKDLNYFGRHGMPSAWATVLCWNKSTTAKLVFDMVESIEKNWDHYKNIYAIVERKYRNDYALAIALNTVMGHTGTWPEIPWALGTFEDDCELEHVVNDTFQAQFRNRENKISRVIIKDQDFHVMNKRAMEKLIGS